jgi:hypothetical protein
MEDCEIIPLCKNSDIFVYNPKIDFFYKKIESSSYFSSPRQQHGIWDVILSVATLNEVIPDNYELIAKRMSTIHNTKSSRMWSTKKNICEDLLWFMHSKKPLNMLYALSDVGFYCTDLPPHEIDTPYKMDIFGPRHGFRKRQELMKKILPPGEIPFNGVIWRKYSFHGQLQKFISDHSDRKIVLIGPWYFKDFGIRAKLQDYEFIEIDYYKASDECQKTYEAILDKQFKNALYFVVGGSFANWLVFKLHNILAENFVIDIGRALDIYYKELAEQLSWKWII